MMSYDDGSENDDDDDNWLWLGWEHFWSDSLEGVPHKMTVIIII